MQAPFPVNGLVFSWKESLRCNSLRATNTTKKWIPPRMLLLRKGKPSVPLLLKATTIRCGWSHCCHSRLPWFFYWSWLTDISSELLLILLQSQGHLAGVFAKTVGEEGVVGTRVLISCCGAQVGCDLGQPQLYLEQTVMEGHRLLPNSSTFVETTFGVDDGLSEMKLIINPLGC